MTVYSFIGFCEERSTLGAVSNLMIGFLVYLQILFVMSTSEQYTTLVMSTTDGTAKLPCKVAQNRPVGNPRLVLWYKNGARTPFLTLDLREDFPDTIIEESMRNRVKSDSTGEWLTIRPLKSSDSAQYKCQVDYDSSPTLAAMVNLTVYESPTKLVLQDGSNRIITRSILGPLTQGSPLSLICIAIGGFPPPRLSWWLGSRLLSDKSFTMSSGLSSLEDSLSNSATLPHSHGSSHAPSNLGAEGETSVISKLRIDQLTRDFAKKNITCRARNSNITEQLEKTIALNVYLQPSSVEITASEAPLQEGVEARFKCEAKGSYPPAKITFEKGTVEQAQKMEATNTINNAKSISWLTFTPTANDHGKPLTCRAYNPELATKGVHKTMILQVVFAPRVKLSLGTSLDIESIKEGKDVYFDCQISSNPKPKIITWHKDGQKLEQNLKRGVLVAGKHLVLQRIHRKYAGNYTCTVENDFGTVTSNAVELPVMFLPVCRHTQKSVSVAEGKSVKLTCDVDARPSDNLTFIWSFNNTLDTVEVSPDRIEVRKTSSVLHYTPLTPRDYGMLSCWATNKVGVQANPCRFAVTEAGPPERVKDCILVNLTGGALEVQCSSGTNGGSAQKFVAKVYASPKHELVRELESHVPRFHVTELTSGLDYLVSITAVNDKGVSEPEEIDAIRLKVAEKRMGDVNSDSVSPLVGVFLGLVGAFALLLFLAIFISRARSARWCHASSSEKTSAQSPTVEDPSDRISYNAEKLQKRSPVDVDSKVTFIHNETEGPDLVKTSNGRISYFFNHSPTLKHLGSETFSVASTANPSNASQSQ